MDTVVPPDLPLVTTGESPSKVEARGFDQETRLEMDLTELTQKLTNDLGLKSSDTGGSGDLSSTAIDLVEKEEGLVPMVSSEKGTVKGGSKGSWVGAVQGQKMLKKYEVEITMKDGIGSVTVPEEITKDVAPLWDDFLIGKFLDNAPHIAKVHAIVNKIWTLNDKAQKIEVYEVNSTTMKFRILNHSDRNRILRRGMWNLAGVPVVMTKWSPVIEKEKPPTQSIPMWVHIKNVPVSMFSWQGLSFVTSPIGSPVRLHPETAQCLNLEVAKIFVNVDLTKDLPKKMNFNIQGEDVLVEFIYPWFPIKCSKCDKWGHSVKACPTTKDGQGDKEEKMEEGEVRKEVESKMEDTMTVQELNVLDATGKITIEITEDNVEEERKSSGGEIEQLKEVSEKEAGWLDVSMGKSSRSPSGRQRELEVDQDTILSQSRFSVLMHEEEGEWVESDREEVVQLEGGSLHEELEEMDEIIPRQSLPRNSKMNHRCLRDKKSLKAQDPGPSYQNKKKPRRQ